MAEQSVGTARLDIVVDTTQMQAEIARAKNLGASLGPEFEKSLSQMSTAQRRASTEALRLAQQAGKTRDEIRLLSLGARGAAPEALDHLRKAMLAARQETAGAGVELNKYGMSARAQAAALRGVPAQLTDIMVSLQGGQAPLTVLLQQGGQLKDMFGGIVPAAKALGSAALGLVNPLTVAAAAAAALALVYHQGTSESKQYALALAESGNAAGQTAQTLAEAARRSADAIGSQGKAAGALSAVVSTGRVASSVLNEVAEASSLWASVTGEEVSQVASVFAKLADEPSEAAAKLNEQYRFLTASVYEQIRALESQGRTDEAAALAQRTFAQALKSRSEEVKAELGTLESAWSSVAGVARGAWDAMLNVGRPRPTEELRKQAAELRKTLDDLAADGGFEDTAGGAAVGGGNRSAVASSRRTATELAAIQQEIAKREREAAAARGETLKQDRENQKIAAEREITDLVASTRTKEQVRADELKKLDAQLRQGLITEERYEQARQAIAKKYRDTGSARSGPRDDAATKLLAQFREGEAALRAQAEAGQQLGTWQRRSVELEQQLADLKEKRVLTAEQRSLLARQDELRTALARNVAEEKSLRLAQERARTEALNESLAAALSGDKQQYADRLGAFGSSARAREELEAQQRLYRDFQRQMTQASRDLSRNQIGQDSYDEQTAALRRSLSERLAAQEEYFADLRELEGDWALGAQGGLEDYADSARNVADATRGVFADAFGGAEDAMVDFVTTGKASFADLTRSILSDLARVALRQGVMGPLAGALGSAISGAFAGGGGGIGSATAADVGSAGGGLMFLSRGGYTGDRPRDEITGLVHGQEFVLNADATARIGRDKLESLNAGGRMPMSGGQAGYVGPAMAGAGGSVVNVQVSVGGDTGQVDASATPGYEQFAQDIGRYIDDRFKQLQARSYRQGGMAWNAREGRM